MLRTLHALKNLHVLHLQICLTPELRVPLQLGQATRKLAKANSDPVDSSAGCLFCAVQSSTLSSLLSSSLNQ